MAIRIVGVDLPQNKRGEIALTYVYGIGRSSSAKILEKAGVDKDLKVKDWTDDQAAKIREIIGAEYKVEGDLRSEVQLNIKRLMDIGCYRGVRKCLYHGRSHNVSTSSGLILASNNGTKFVTVIKKCLQTGSRYLGCTHKHNIFHYLKSFSVSARICTST